MNLNDLVAFVRTAELGTFSRAADELGVPKSTVSRRVSRLEEELGLALLVRSSRSFVLSDDGRALYERASPALREVADVERDLLDSASTPRGLLRLTASIDFGSSVMLTSLLAEYARRYPEVRVELQLANRVVDLLEESFDVGFRTHTAPLPGRDDLVARRLGPVEVAVYGSPAYLAEHGRPTTTAELAAHRTLAHTGAYRHAWPVRPHLTADDFGPLAGMIACGAGLGMLPAFVACPFVQTGRLEAVEMDWDLPRATLSLVWLRSRHLAPRVRAFIDLAVEQMAAPDAQHALPTRPVR